ncbi:DUF4846 domain-containing protein [Nannocystis sp. ILAH1]|uniref:DUF4846 domain-containing protein n=1 Tax=unclassified Nannocystis TaxID=2627009 RepID=UPI0022704E94|nr:MULTISPECIES: DUF4846 domain-containing protein [unclassified Nannocystis]MCY0995106.1 DUF4846 domain-containing protein [Nannocystis sp. ILAH1]MCY1069954.1 DUF4846 domain-containing protein [Nannocystis sp. RBIL2]
MLRSAALGLVSLLACDSAGVAPPAAPLPAGSAHVSPEGSPRTGPEGHVAKDMSPDAPPAASPPVPADSAPKPDLPPLTQYTWLTEAGGEPPARDQLAAAIAPPAGAKRVELPAGSFGAWLRGLPLLPAGTSVLLYNGDTKPNQAAHFRVVDLDVGDRDLQQCADAVMRLRVEYQWAADQRRAIAFKLTDGTPWDFTSYLGGTRLKLVGKKAERVPGSPRPATRETLRGYMRTLFTYAGTASIAAELPRRELAALTAGDVLVQGGFPGHAVLVLDVAEDDRGARYFLLGQSYMPAQQFHVLKNPGDSTLSPWYRADALKAGAMTPEWGPFTDRDLRRFRDG